MGLLHAHDGYGVGNGETDLSLTSSIGEPCIKKKGTVVGYRSVEDIDVAGKRVLLRVDFNVPVNDDGAITDATRIDRALPTIKLLRERGAKTLILSHFGRPKGERRSSMSLAPVAPVLSEKLGCPVSFADDCIGEPASKLASSLGDADVAILENTRFHAGDEKNDAGFVEALAQVGDIYVNDAFSAAHRAHGSTEGIARKLPAVAGLALARELDYLGASLGAPERPMMAVVGGAKVSTKIELLLNLIPKADMIVVGGAMANTFLFAQGVNVGKSLCEPGLVDTALEILDQASKATCEIVLPSDVVVAKEFAAGAANRVAHVDNLGGDNIDADEMALDLGPASVNNIAEKMASAKTLVWNGPLGAFEIQPFDTATVEAARFAAKQAKNGALTVVAGGGDTVAALNHAGVVDDFTYVSTAGGAFLEWLEGKTLPGVAALERAAT